MEFLVRRWYYIFGLCIMSAISSGSTWRTLSSISVSNGSNWKPVIAGYISGGSWRQFFSNIGTVSSSLSTPSSSEIDVIWGTYGGVGTPSYDIYISTSSTPPGTSTIATANVSLTHYYHTGLSVGIIYYYWVRVVVSGVNGLWNTGISGETQVVPVLSAATNVLGGFNFSLSNYNSAYTWSASVTSGSGSVSPSTITTNGTITVSGMSGGASATVTVYTSYGSEATGSASVAGTALTPTAPNAPNTPTASIASTSSVTVSWTDNSNGGSAITSHNIYSSPSVTLTPSTSSGTSVTVSGTFAFGTAYTFAVNAVNAYGTSLLSGYSSAVTPNPTTVPGQASIGTVSVTNTTNVSIIYTDGAANGSAITGRYIVSSPSLSLSYTGSSGSPINVSGAFVNGTAYTFTISSINSIGTGPASTSSNSVTPAQSPTTPGTPSSTYISTVGGNENYSMTFATSTGSPTITYYIKAYGSADSYSAVRNTFGPFSGGSTGTVTVLNSQGPAWEFAAYATNSVGTSSDSAKSAPH